MNLPVKEYKVDQKSSVKKKIVIPICTNLVVRNFIESGAFRDLSRHYELYFISLSSVNKEIHLVNCFTVSNRDLPRRAKLRTRSDFISMKRFQKRSATFPIKYYETYYKLLPFQKKIVADFLTLPVVAECFMKVNEFTLGTMSEVDKIVEQIKPDFMLIPSAFNDSFTIDCLKTAKKKGIKHLFVMFNWDNVSSKGVLPVLPDYIAVWGEQTREHANKIHRIPNECIFILGSPQFEHYRRDLKLTREEFRKKNEVPLDKKVLLFAGMSRLSDEISILCMLEEAIEKGELPDVHILFRPHPWKAVQPYEKNFFDCGFRHITMDVQLCDHYKKILQNPKESVHQDTFTPDYEYYPSLFNAIDGVISPGTTLGIEAMAMGKPVLIKAFPDDDGRFWADVQIHAYEHHSCWKKMKGTIICSEKKAFIKDCNKLLELIHHADISEVIKKEVRYVVYNDEQFYSQRLLECVNRLI